MSVCPAERDPVNQPDERQQRDSSPTWASSPQQHSSASSPSGSDIVRSLLPSRDVIMLLRTSRVNNAANVDLYLGLRLPPVRSSSRALAPSADPGVRHTSCRAAHGHGQGKSFGATHDARRQPGESTFPLALVLVVYLSF